MYSMDLEDVSAAEEEAAPSAVWMPSSGLDRSFQVVYDPY
jgi:hypothetical protein